jgi:hypothetical protein
MPTPRQLELIRDLLGELEWTARDIRREVGEEYGEYEDLDTQMASELIGALMAEKYGSRPVERF